MNAVVVSGLVKRRAQIAGDIEKPHGVLALPASTLSLSSTRESLCLEREDKGRLRAAFAYRPQSAAPRALTGGFPLALAPHVAETSAAWSRSG
jgi:hypothetical protein